MRQKISTYDLETTVNLICRAQDSFSYYDITSKIRSVMPQYEILHEDVKKVVDKYLLTISNVSVSNNGQYKVFTKNSPEKVVSNQTLTKLQKLLNEKKQVTTVATPPSLVGASVVIKEVLPLQKYGKLSLTSFIKEKLPKATTVSIDKLDDKIVISIGGQYNTDEEIRIRTGFKANTVSAQISDKEIVITPN